MSIDNRVSIYMRPEIKAALDAMAAASGRSRSDMVAQLVEDAPIVPKTQGCRNCGLSPCRPTCVLSYPVQSPKESR